MDNKEINQKIDKYIKMLNIKSFSSFDSFIEYIEETYSENLFQQIVQELINRIDDNEDNLYKIKNNNISLSLDFVSWSLSFYKKLFRKILSSNDIKGNVLDIGCDNGFITIFLAITYPNSNFIGIDKNPNSIEIAKNLACKYNIDNIEFFTLDILNSNNYFDMEHFDTILSIRIIHELSNNLNILNKYLFNIFRLLKTNGTFINSERLMDKTALDNWIKNLKKHDFKIQKNINYIFFNEFEYRGTLPLIIAKK